MKREISSEIFGRPRYEGFRYDEVTSCPLCHKGIQPIALKSFGYEHKTLGFRFYILNVCPLCDEAFVSVYQCRNPHSGATFSGYHLASYPKRSAPISLDPRIKMVSDLFPDIYMQAYEAEQSQLDQIAGIGYRRALEFLVKDYCIFRHPDLKEKIKEQPLSQCISQYIDYPRLKTVAERATWLGNDQTHYVQKHTDKDLEDLKRLITLTMHWIIIELGVDEAEAIERK